MKETLITQHHTSFEALVCR